MLESSNTIVTLEWIRNLEGNTHLYWIWVTRVFNLILWNHENSEERSEIISQSFYFKDMEKEINQGQKLSQGLDTNPSVLFLFTEKENVNSGSIKDHVTFMNDQPQLIKHSTILRMLPTSEMQIIFPFHSLCLIILKCK